MTKISEEIFKASFESIRQRFGDEMILKTIRELRELQRVYDTKYTGHGKLGTRFTLREWSDKSKLYVNECGIITEFSKGFHQREYGLDGWEDRTYDDSVRTYPIDDLPYSDELPLLIERYRIDWNEINVIRIRVG